MMRLAKKLNNVLIFLISLISFYHAIRDLSNGDYNRLLGSLSIILVLFIPIILKKLFNIKISSGLEFIYIIFIFIAYFLGIIINLYNVIWWYDLFVHFLLGIFSGIISLFVLRLFKQNKDKNKIFNSFFIICFSLMVAVLWEFCEFSVYILFNKDVQHHLTTGVFDTMQDMIVAFFGSLFMAIYNFSCSKMYK